MIPSNAPTSNKISHEGNTRFTHCYKKKFFSKCLESLKFYEPPDLSHSLDVYIRISEHKKPDRTLKVYRINDAKEDITIRKLKNDAVSWLENKNIVPAKCIIMDMN